VLYHLLVQGAPPPLSKADSLRQAAELLSHSPDAEDRTMSHQRPARRPGGKASATPAGPARPPLDAETMLSIGLVIGQDLARAKATTARADLARLVVLRTLAALGVVEARPPAKPAAPARRRHRPGKAGQAAAASDGGVPRRGLAGRQLRVRWGVSPRGLGGRAPTKGRGVGGGPCRAFASRPPARLSLRGPPWTTNCRPRGSSSCSAGPSRPGGPGVVSVVAVGPRCARPGDFG
jgi:hypothetical protein